MFHFRILRPIFTFLWARTKKDHPVEAVSSEYCQRNQEERHGSRLSIPADIRTARVIRRVISEGYTDAVSIARPLIANRDLPQILPIRQRSSR